MTCYLRRSGPVTAPGVVVVDMAVGVVVDVVVVVEPVFIVGMTAADSFSFSFSLSALSSDQYLTAHTHTHTVGDSTGAQNMHQYSTVPAGETGGASAGGGAKAAKACG